MGKNKQNLGGEMTRSVKSLLHKQEYLSLDPQNPHRVKCNNALLEFQMEMEIGTGESPEAHGPATLAYAPVSNEVQVPALTLGTHTHTHAHTPPIVASWGQGPFVYGDPLSDISCT